MPKPQSRNQAGDYEVSTEFFKEHHEQSQYEIAACCQQAFGWMLQEDDEGRAMAWHGGQTAGFSAYIGFYLDGSAAVVFLNNQSFDHSAEMHRRLRAAIL